MKTSSLLRRQQQSRPKRGFALIVTLSLMILLTVIAVGLLSLSSISLRSTGGAAASALARANARMAMMIALGELQKTAGPDQRITADSSIYGADIQNPNVVGVWKSWSLKIAEGGPAPANSIYASMKTGDNFLGWLSSSVDPTTKPDSDWPKGATDANPVDLFTIKSDGLAVAASRIGIATKKGNSSAVTGAFAWTVAQDATRAKINIGGPEKADRIANDQIQAQARPNVSSAATLQQPTANWNTRANSVISMAQAKLDSDLWKGGKAAPEKGDYTTEGFGLLTDPVKGGFKTDLNLGFELNDADFAAATWGDYKNPFSSKNVTAFAVPSAYATKSQRPLFKPLTSAQPGSVHVDLKFTGADASFEIPAATVPTFNTLRSFYRTPYYMYNTADGPTIFERPMDHVGVTKPSNPPAIPPPGAPPAGLYTQTGYRPILDRVLYVLSIAVGDDNEVRLIIQPVISLWNPYNVALEIEGAVVCPWLDIPFTTKWTWSPAKEKDPTGDMAWSQLLGSQGMASGVGRQVKPYFTAVITGNGGLATTSNYIRFKPGEVRVFAPSGTTDTKFLSSANPVDQRIFLKPVDTTNPISSKVGLSVPMKTPYNSYTRPVAPTDNVRMKLTLNMHEAYPYAICYEDATRAKVASPALGLRGAVVADIQTTNFAVGDAPFQELNSAAVATGAELKTVSFRKPFGMVETYHRTAKSLDPTRVSDIVYTVNPRQSYINRYVTEGTFKAAPHYESRVTTISSYNEVMQSVDGGRSGYYGLSNGAPEGRTQLAFFDVPQQPILSLGALQHADLSGTAYSTSYQIGNSWASAYVAAKAPYATASVVTNKGVGDITYSRGAMPIYDYSYLANEALMDSFFCSSVAPTMTPASSGGSKNAWLGNGFASPKTSVQKTFSDFVEDPDKHPLRNSRMKLYLGSSKKEDLKSAILNPEACVKIAEHLRVDGAFNVNSTSVKAWTAYLSGMRDGEITVRNNNGGSSTASSSEKTAFPRLREPMGTDSDFWQGYRALTDGDITTLATNIVAQVRLRGPFQSLAEFVNRRLGDASAMALKGAVQTAIDTANLNQGVMATSNKPIVTSFYPPSRTNIAPTNTTVGVPGYLTQADVLQPLLPSMTVRSDTFTIRSYGEAKDSSGKVIATARCEAVVQRMPEFVDPTDKPDTVVTPAGTLNQTNVAFGRRFSIVSFRYLSKNEVVSGADAT